MSNPAIDVFVNQLTHSCMLLDYCVHPELKLVVACGKMQRVECNEMRTIGLDIVVEHLETFFARRLNENKCDYDKMSAHDRRKFDNEHVMVSISLISPSQLRLVRMKKSRDGRGLEGNLDDSLVVELSTPPAEFFQTLLNVADCTGSD